MAELEKKTVYDIFFSGSYKVEAKTADDAFNKAKEWIEENAGKLTFTYKEQEVWVEAAEDD